jgi:hypothetical protein
MREYNTRDKRRVNAKGRCDPALDTIARPDWPAPRWFARSARCSTIAFCERCAAREVRAQPYPLSPGSILCLTTTNWRGNSAALAPTSRPRLRVQPIGSTPPRKLKGKARRGTRRLGIRQFALPALPQHSARPPSARRCAHPQAARPTFGKAQKHPEATRPARYQSSRRRITGIRSWTSVI